jgi:hypothetical protein
MKFRMYLSVFMMAFLLVACAQEEGADVDPLEASDFEMDDKYGKPVMDLDGELGKADSATGGKTLAASGDNSETQVWSVWNQWEDTDTPDARKEGIAWGANSGLTWEEKYRAWINSLEPAESTEGYGSYTTYMLTTPYGRTLLAPRLECAETAIFMRSTFASWHHLPFIMQAHDPSAGTVYFGHFGIRTKNGKYANTPKFRSYYNDYEGTAASEYSTNWPRDNKLRKRKISSNGDDENTFLCEGCMAGAYFDEIFLNKRVGHFQVWVLTYTGSMHLASSQNTFNLKPEAVSAGDVLLERWQKNGIGHTLVVKKVEALEGGNLDAQLASGSMPRRQPKWEDGASSKSYFTNTYCGGPGENESGDAYAALGGGLKRWRQPVVRNGYWVLEVPASDHDVYINSSDYTALADRIDQFEQLLGSLSPEDQQQFLISKIDEKRLHLQNFPASCAARTAREDAFTELYALSMLHFNQSKQEVDAAHRTIADYVFAELEYPLSKTCCWNSTTPAMYQIIMDYNLGITYNHDTQECYPPEIFMWKEGGYHAFKAHAATMNMADQWVDWTEDEPCAAANVESDKEKEHSWTAMCEIKDALFGGGGDPVTPDAGCADEFTNNHTAAGAAEVSEGTYDELKVCHENPDYYVVETQGESYVVKAHFSNDQGDIDLALFNEALVEIDSSTSMDDVESVKLPAEAGTYFIEVRLYSSQGATDYSLSIQP